MYGLNKKKIEEIILTKFNESHLKFKTSRC